MLHEDIPRRPKFKCNGPSRTIFRNINGIATTLLVLRCVRSTNVQPPAALAPRMPHEHRGYSPDAGVPKPMRRSVAAPIRLFG
jgi:hypothetical protein